MGREGSGGLHRASEQGGKGSQRCFPSRHLPTGDRGATSARPCYVGFNVAGRGLEKSLQSRHQPTSRKRISLGVARSPTNINLMHSPPTTRFALMGSPFAGRRFQFSYDNHLKSCGRPIDVRSTTSACTRANSAPSRCSPLPAPFPCVLS